MLVFVDDVGVYEAARGLNHLFEDTDPGKICRTVDDVVTAVVRRLTRCGRSNASSGQCRCIRRHSGRRVIDELVLTDPRARLEAGKCGHT